MNPLLKLSIAGSTVVCAALISFSWSEQRGVSLSVESAQARVGRPLTPVSVAGVARRQNRRAAYGYGNYGGGPNNQPGLVGGDDAGTGGGFGRVSYGRTGAWGAAGSGWGGGPYYGSGPARTAAAYGAYGGGPNNLGGLVGGDDSGTASPSGWYLAGGVMKCASGTWVTGGHGRPMRCP